MTQQETDPFINVGPTTAAQELAGGVATMSVQNFETTTQPFVVPEVAPNIAATYENKNPNTKYEVGCGDDRPKTSESHTALQQAGTAPETTAMIRYYGAAAGMARVLGVAVAAQSPDALAQYSGSFVAFTKEVVDRIEATSNVTVEMHSAESNEGNPAAFNPDSAEGLGCAYAANVGKLADICVRDNGHSDLTITEGTSLLGDSVEHELVKRANDAFGSHFFGTEYGTAGLTRNNYVELGLPTQVLKGSHAKPQDTFVIANFESDKVSNPTLAAQEGLQFYNVDVTQVAEMLMRAFPELNLDPEVLFAVMDQDIRATRVALAGGNAADLELRRLGDPQMALTYLKSLQI